MRSFELPIDRWRSIERELRVTLDEIEARRSRFPEAVMKLENTIERFHKLDLGAPFDLLPLAKGAKYAPVPQAETLAFERRHETGSSAADYGTMRRRIEENYTTMRLSCDLLREMHRYAVGTDTEGAGEWKARRNFFPIFDAEGRWVAARITIPLEEIPTYMEQLHDSLHAAIAENAVDPLLWIAAYALDIFAIHPFQDGNGRITRLAMLLLLYQSGHSFAKYIGIEGIISRRRSAYTESIIRSYDRWSAARHDPTPWCRFMAELVLDAYREFLSRNEALSVLADQTAAISDAMAKMPKSFPTADLKKLLPGVPDTIAVIVLNRMKERGKLNASLDRNKVQWLKDGSS
jgi:hypothetical protein